MGIAHPHAIGIGHKKVKVVAAASGSHLVQLGVEVVGTTLKGLNL